MGSSSWILWFRPPNPDSVNEPNLSAVPDNSPKISQGEITPDNLILVDFPIYIDGNWSAYVEKYDWATGNGTEKDPYIIEGIYVNNPEQTAHISIEKAEYFIIRNVTVSNYAKPYGHHIFAGIYIGKGEYGLIDNCTIINCSHGISLAEAKDSLKITNCKFIGSHDDPITGMGCAVLIHEAKGVNISYNDIYNFYSGVVIYDAEECYVENNRIETSFVNISNTGVYFSSVNDSTIKNNDFYGCKSETQNSTEISISSFDDPIILDDCINIIVYGNNFYSNLIDDPNIPNDPDVPDDIPNNSDNPDIIDVDTFDYKILILVCIFGSLVGISIFLKLRKRINKK